MSLINQMLTDLDKRKTGSTGGGDAVPEPIPVAGAGRSGRRYLIWGGAAAVLLLIALLLFWDQDSTETLAQQDRSEPAASIERQQAAAVQSAPVVANEEEPISSQTSPAEASAQTRIAFEPAVSTTDSDVAVERVEPVALAAQEQPVAAAEDMQATPIPPADMAQEQSISQQTPETYEPEKTLLPIEPVLEAEPEPVVSSNQPVKRAVSRKDNSFERAQRYLSQGRLAEGESALRETLDQDGNNHKARELLAGLLIRGNRNEEALGLLKEGTGLAPQHPGFALLQARILMQQGDRPQAARLLEEVARSGTGNKQVITLLAVLYQQQKQHERALELYRMLIEREPGLGSNWAGAAISLEALGNPDEAMAAYQRALNSPNLAPALRAYAIDRIQNLGQNR
jgi:Tfp pilus assembly protein PilF